MNTLQPVEQGEALKINFVIKDGFGVENGSQNENNSKRPRVMFHKAKSKFN